MKIFLLELVLYVAKICMKIIYFFIKLFTKQKQYKIIMLSRQSNNMSIDFRLLKEELDKIDGLEIIVSCRKIPDKLSGKIKYCFEMIKDMHSIATSKICIIDGYNIAISALKHKEGLKVLQIWHALGAIKKFGYQALDTEEGSNSKIAQIMQMHENYSLVTCASKATREFYVEAFNTDRDKIKILGMPRIDYLLGKNGEIDETTKKILKEYPNLSEKQNILYVPTFRKRGGVNLEELISKIDKEKYNLIIKLHPLDKTQIDEKYIVKGYSSTDLIKIADIVITDYSAMAFEVAVLNKQLYFYLYDVDKYETDRGLNINLMKEMASCVGTNIDELFDIIENKEYDYESLKRFRERYIETMDTENIRRIIDYIEKSIMQ